jgi:hypothetical protein
MLRKFIFIIDGEVGPDLMFEDSGEGLKFDTNRALAAALSSNPTVLEVPHDSSVKMGWTWDGVEFNPPSEE